MGDRITSPCIRRWSYICPFWLLGRGGDLFVKNGVSISPSRFARSSLSPLAQPPSLNPARVWGALWAPPAGSPDRKRILVHFERKIMPLPNEITDNMVKSRGVLPLWDTRGQILDCQDTKTPQNHQLCRWVHNGYNSCCWLVTLSISLTTQCHNHDSRDD